MPATCIRWLCPNPLGAWWCCSSRGCRALRRPRAAGRAARSWTLSPGDEAGVSCPGVACGKFHIENQYVVGERHIDFQKRGRSIVGGGLQKSNPPEGARGGAGGVTQTEHRAELGKGVQTRCLTKSRHSFVKTVKSASYLWMGIELFQLIWILFELHLTKGAMPWCCVVLVGDYRSCLPRPNSQKINS